MQCLASNDCSEVQEKRNLASKPSGIGSHKLESRVVQKKDVTGCSFASDSEEEDPLLLSSSSSP